MCIPAIMTGISAAMTPQMFIGLAGQMFKMRAASKQNRAAIYQANEQNRIARENAIRKQTSEDYKILQIRIIFSCFILKIKKTNIYYLYLFNWISC